MSTGREQQESQSWPCPRDAQSPTRAWARIQCASRRTRPRGCSTASSASSPCHETQSQHEGTHLENTPLDTLTSLGEGDFANLAKELFAETAGAALGDDEQVLKLWVSIASHPQRLTQRPGAPSQVEKLKQYCHVSAVHPSGVKAHDSHSDGLACLVTRDKGVGDLVVKQALLVL